MKVKLSKYIAFSDHYDVQDRVVCELNGAEVEVRQMDDGRMVIAIKNGPDNKVTMESRAAAIWLEVKGEGDA